MSNKTQQAPRPINWPAFRRGFGDGLAVAGATTILAAFLAWQLVFPTIGLLWIVGWLA